MTRQRADLGFSSALEDLGGFTAKSTSATLPRPAKAQVAEAAMASGFHSREPQTPEPPKTQRRRRTGRNVQFNIKTTPETIAAFCQVADANGWGLGETLERAVALLQATGLKANSPDGDLK